MRVMTDHPLLTTAPSFKWFLYWFVVIQVTAVVCLWDAIGLGAFGAGLAGIYDQAVFDDLMAQLDKLSQPIGMGLAIILCGIVASVHRIRF